MMANEAHKEPTMEEILASIRKIISDDDAPAADTKADDLVAADVIVEKVPDELDVTSAEDLLDDVTDEVVGSIFDDEDDFDLSIDEPDVAIDDLPEPVSFDEMAGVDTSPAQEPEPMPVIEEPANETFEAPEPVEAVAEPEPEIQATEEADMAASAKYEKTILTNDNTAESAAGTLGKLISSMDMGGENTIEALVREMLKPMIKDWLDSNLPGIVEEKVEAEVQRIARMAR